MRFEGSVEIRNSFVKREFAVSSVYCLVGS